MGVSVGEDVWEGEAYWLCVIGLYGVREASWRVGVMKEEARTTRKRKNEEDQGET